MTQYGEETLPPLPSSNPDGAEWNKTDNYYDVKPREFWSKAKLIREELDDFRNCDHYFISKTPGVECKNCHVGFISFFEIRNGKLYSKGEPLGI
jgi:hypothetical protein